MRIYLNTLSSDFEIIISSLLSYSDMMGNYENITFIYNDILVRDVSLIVSDEEIIVRKKIGCIWNNIFSISPPGGHTYDFGLDLCLGAVKLLSHPPTKEIRNPRGAGRKSSVHISTVDAMIDYRKQGFNLQYIANEFNVSISTVSNLLTKHKSRF